MSATVKIIVLLIAVSFFSACANTGTMPRTLAVQVQSEIERASEIGAEEHAPLALRSARQNLASAQSYIEDERYDEARLKLEKAEVDAEYAIAKTSAEKSQAAVEQINANLDALRREM